MARYVCAMLLKMKEVFQVIESMKRAAVIEDYAVAGAVGALFYVEPFSTAAIDFLVRLPLSNGLLVSLEPIHSWLHCKGYRMEREKVGGGTQLPLIAAHCCHAVKGSWNSASGCSGADRPRERTNQRELHPRRH